MNATEQFATNLEKALQNSGTWTRSTSDLVASAPRSIMLAQGLRAALLLVPGDDVKPGRFRADLDLLVRKAQAPTRGQTRDEVPWSQLIVVLVFQKGAAQDMRTFIGNDRRAVSPKQLVQGGWVDLQSGEAAFRSTQTPFETDLLNRLKQAAGAGRATPSGPAAKPALVAPSTAPASAATRPSLLSRLSGKPLSTAALTATLCAVTTVFAFDPFTTLRYGGLNLNLLQQGQIYRLLSGVFAQNGWIEFAVDASALLFLGAALERVYGTITFLALFTTCALAAAGGTVLSGGAEVYSGATEAICGLCAAVGVLSWRLHEAEILVDRGVVPALAGFGLYTFLTLLGGPDIVKTLHPHASICWQAVVGATLAGALFAFAVPAPRPRAPLAWKIVAPLLLVLAAAPFAALGAAVYTARSPAARIVHTDPRGFTVKTPPGTVYVQGTDGPVFVGGDYFLHVGIMSGLQVPAYATIDSHRDELLSDLALRHMKIKTQEIVAVGSRRWLVIRAVQADESERQYGYAIEDAVIYTVTLWGASPDKGIDAFRAIIDTFSLSPRATPTASPRKRPS